VNGLGAYRLGRDETPRAFELLRSRTRELRSEGTLVGYPMSQATSWRLSTDRLAAEDSAALAAPHDQIEPSEFDPRIPVLC
jgi:hypothetical protein